MRALVLHGPNLNLLGMREQSVYGSLDLDAVNEHIGKAAAELGIEVSIHQSSSEGELIDLLHGGIGKCDGALLNPAAYAHTSRALADAMRAVPYPIIEVHLTNIHARESWRRMSFTAEAAAGVVTGFGPASYVVALNALKHILEG